FSPEHFSRIREASTLQGIADARAAYRFPPPRDRFDSIHVKSDFMAQLLQQLKIAPSTLAKRETASDAHAVNRAKLECQRSNKRVSRLSAKLEIERNDQQELHPEALDFDGSAFWLVDRRRHAVWRNDVI